MWFTMIESIERIDTLGKCILSKVIYTPTFKGCQCSKSCNCREECNKSKRKYVQFQVFTGRRYHRFTTESEARECMERVNNQQIKQL